LPVVTTNILLLLEKNSTVLCRLTTRKAIMSNAENIVNVEKIGSSPTSGANVLAGLAFKISYKKAG